MSGRVILVLAIVAALYLVSVATDRLTVVFLGLLTLSVWLAWRVDQLEHRLAKLDRIQAIDASEFFTKLRAYHLGRFPKLRQQLDPAEAAEELASALATQLPALEGVLVLSMWMSRDFVREVGITDTELDGFRERLADTRFWPMPSMTIEQWSTHTTVFDEVGNRRTIYHHTHDWKHRPSILWERAFSATAGSTPQACSLEIVLWDNAIKCWARGGRFKGKYWSGESEDEYQFVTIPLDQARLSSFLRPDDDDSVEAPFRYESRPWDRQYNSAGGERAGWSLQVMDYSAWARR